MTALPQAAGPLYEKVKDYVLRRIGGGWPLDRRLPSENELVATLGVSRMTVHRALRELTEAGILVRVRGVGTFVAAPKPQSALVEIRDIAEEIRARGHAHRAEVLALGRLVAGPDLAAAFEFSGPEPVFRSLVVHFEAEVPVQLEERFVNPRIAPDYDRQDFSRRTTYEYLQAMTPLTEVEHVISSIAADATTAERLRLAPGEPCLHLYRRTWSGAVVATVNRFTYAAHVSLGSRYRPAGRS